MSELNDLEEFLPIDMEGRDAILGKFNSVDDLAKSYMGLEKKMGQGKRVPSPESPKQEWDSFYQELGAPSTAEAYQTPEELPEGFSGMMENARKAAHEKGLTQDQFSNMVEPFVEAEKERQITAENAVKESQDRWKQTTKDQYGRDYEAKAALAQRAYESVVGNNPDLQEVFNATGMGHHPAVMDFMVKLGGGMSDETVPSGSGGDLLGFDPAGLAARARKLAKIGAIHNSRHPEYEEHFAEFMKIQQQLSEEGYEGMSDPRLQPSSKWVSGR